jgi:hypothetical protein
MVIHICRREFIAMLDGAAATWPLSARADDVGLVSASLKLRTDP